MTSDPDSLRGAYRGLQAAGSEQCPGDEELAGLVLGEGSAALRAALADHVVACRRCTESARILFELRQETDATAASVPRRRWLKLAAAAAALAAIGLLIGRSPQRTASIERGLPSRAAEILPADGAELPESPERFRWPRLDGVDGYDVKLYRDAGDLAWESGRVTAPEAELPPQTRAGLEAGRSYYWVVEAESPAGATRLGPFSFRLAAARPN
jgi:hypothetical protein